MMSIQGSDTYVKAAGTFIETRTRGNKKKNIPMPYESDDAGGGRVIGSSLHVSHARYRTMSTEGLAVT